jgi:hypothetical protein
MTDHEHEWERGAHMKAAFGVDGRKPACAICGIYREPPGTYAPHHRLHPVVAKETTDTPPRIVCSTCDRDLVLVSESVHFTPFWRHKPKGYEWGVEVRKERERIRLALAALPGLFADDSEYISREEALALVGSAG